MDNECGSEYGLRFRTSRRSQTHIMFVSRVYTNQAPLKQYNAIVMVTANRAAGTRHHPHTISPVPLRVKRSDTHVVAMQTHAFVYLGQFSVAKRINFWSAENISTWPYGSTDTHARTYRARALTLTHTQFESDPFDLHAFGVHSHSD